MRTRAAIALVAALAVIATATFASARVDATPTLDVATVATTSAPVTTVSLTWDDGRASQINTLELHRSHGMQATYYVNSGWIGSSGYYMSRTQLDQLHAAGSEIGGHGDNHVRLTTLDTATATAEVCNDRTRLVSWYPDSGHSFSYPYGSVNETVESIVAGCGYESARTIVGVRTPTSCFSCPTAESIPPTDPFRLITSGSVENTTTLADLQALVEQGTGGWVIPIFHDLGVSGTYSVSTAIYTAFLDWLAARPDTVVRTVADVMSGTPPPTTTTSTSSTTTSSSTTSSTSTSTSTTSTSSSTTTSTSTTTTSTTVPSTSIAIANAGLESDTNRDKSPDCWERVNGSGNRVSWSRTTGHDSRWASQVLVRSYRSGDVLLRPTASCAPRVGPGTYELGVWFVATTRSRVSVERLDHAGLWSSVTIGPWLASTSRWTQVLQTFDLPTDTVAVRFGLALSSTGQLTTDDYTLRRIG